MTVSPPRRLGWRRHGRSWRPQRWQATRRGRLPMSSWSTTSRPASSRRSGFAASRSSRRRPAGPGLRCLRCPRRALPSGLGRRRAQVVSKMVSKMVWPHSVWPHPRPASTRGRQSGTASSSSWWSSRTLPVLSSCRPASGAATRPSTAYASKCRCARLRKPARSAACAGPQQPPLTPRHPAALPASL